MWSNRISPKKNGWNTIDEVIKQDMTAYTMLDKFNEDDGLHDLAQPGKHFRIMILGPGKVLSAEGWQCLFQEIYHESMDLAESPKGQKLCTFGLQLAFTAPTIIFEDAEWIVKNGGTTGLQSVLVTDAWTGT